MNQACKSRDVPRWWAMWLDSLGRFSLLSPFVWGMVLLLLIAANLGEAWVVVSVMDGTTTVVNWLLVVAASFVGLAVYTAILAGVALYLTGSLELSGTQRTLLSLAFVLVYGAAVSKSSNLHVVAPLACAKLFSMWLFLKFWDAQAVPPWKRGVHRFAWSGFFLGRWLLVACWLLNCLGFSLALVSSDPIIAMSAGESLALLGALFLLFRMFVRNPLAQPEETAPLTKSG